MATLHWAQRVWPSLTGLGSIRKPPTPQRPQPLSPSPPDPQPAPRPLAGLASLGKDQVASPDSGLASAVLLGASLKLLGHSPVAEDSEHPPGYEVHPTQTPLDTLCCRAGLRKPQQVIPSCLVTAPHSKLTGNWPLNPPGDKGRMRKNYGCGSES